MDFCCGKWTGNNSHDNSLIRQALRPVFTKVKWLYLPKIRRFLPQETKNECIKKALPNDPLITDTRWNIYGRKKTAIALWRCGFFFSKDLYGRLKTVNWLRGPDLNRRPSGYEPDELPGCSTPRPSLLFHQVTLLLLILIGCGGRI